MSRGSVFRIWDIHVHTPASFEHQFTLTAAEKPKFGNDVWGKYIDELEKVQDIAVIGICDYFDLDGYKKVIEYQQKNRLQNFDLILPNIEFRLDTLAGKRKINYHVIFSEELPIDIIQREFLGQLTIRTSKGTERTLCRESIIEIGQKLKTENISFKGKSDYEVGCSNIEVRLQDIVGILEKKKNDIFEGKYILILPYSEWEKIPWGGQAHRIKQELITTSHAFFSSSDKDRQWALGKAEGYTAAKFVSEFGALKPCLHGSDAHCFEKLCKPDLDRYCWIKADTSFEGLKQILYEPEERVIVCKDYPEPRKHVYSLDYVRFNEERINEELTLSAMNMPLNTNLVAIVGGKGTGKTAFIDLIVNCFNDRCLRGVKENEDSNSFVQRIEQEAPNLGLELGFIGDETLPFFKNLTDDTFFKEIRITYLPQGKIEEFSGSRHKLDIKIEEIIFENKEVVNSGYQAEYDQIESEIEESRNSILKTNIELFQLEKKTEEQVFKEIKDELSIKKGKLSDNQAKIKELTDGMETTAKEGIEALKKKEEELRSKLGSLTLLSNKISELKNNLEEFQYLTNETITDIDASLKDFGIVSEIPLITFQTHMDAIAKVSEETQTINEKLSMEIKNADEEITQLSGLEKTHAELLSENEQILNEIKGLEQKLSELEKEKGKIPSLEGKRLSKYIRMIDLYIDWKKHYAQVMHIFSQGKSDIMMGVDFVPYVHFDTASFIELGEDTLHMGKVRRDEVKALSELLNNIVSEDDKQKRDKLIIEYIAEITKYKGSMKRTSDNIKFYNWAFGDYFSLSTHKKYNNIPIEKLSMGQKGTVLLKLFLAEGDYPLLIDQPEENLDNKSVYTELVKAFRQAKRNRQVIIATNNANLVVNTDAEQLIIADFKDGVIKYKSGSIEDKQIRTEITEILEGGPEAFRIREKRYNIKLYPVEDSTET